MQDLKFINERIKRGQAAKTKVQQTFFILTPAQLNWKPSPTQWSIAKCLEHLLISDRSYFEVLEKIAMQDYQMSLLEKYSPLTSFWGKTLKDQLQEKVKRKMTAPSKLKPSQSNKSADFVQVYLNNLDLFLDHIWNCRTVDLDKTIITSPTLKMVTYSLRDAFQFLIEHEHRHINQGIRLIAHESFPEK
jgi:uncharacterized damage-inducible protein DinB